MSLKDLVLSADESAARQRELVSQATKLRKMLKRTRAYVVALSHDRGGKTTLTLLDRLLKETSHMGEQE